MADNHNRIIREGLLQEGVSCAQATLHAIVAADLFNAPPAGEHEKRLYDHGTWLLAMLGDQLASIQTRVDALDAEISAGGRA